MFIALIAKSSPAYINNENKTDIVYIMMTSLTTDTRIHLYEVNEYRLNVPLNTL